MSTAVTGAVPDVSVVIVNWNTRDLLNQALHSLYEETRGVDFEAIVVDNGSTDGSAELIESKWSGVKLVALPRNVGFTSGNNAGIAEARGRHVLLLNSDTIVLPTTLKGLAGFLDRHADVGCAGPRHLNADLSLQRSMDDFPTLFADFASYTGLARVRPIERFLASRFAWWSSHDEQREVGWVNGSCIMVRREVIDQVGGLDEGFFIYGEELDWCYRMREAGWRVCFTPDAEVIHLGGQAMNRAPDRRVVLLYSGQLRFYRKHYPAWRYLGLRGVVASIAAVRLLMLTGLLVAVRLGVQPQASTWESITQERVITDPRTMMRAWWQIMCGGIARPADI